MAALSKLLVELDLKDGVSPGLSKIERQASGFGKALSGALSVAGGLGLFSVFSKITSGIGGMVSAGLDFEAAMSNVNSIAQLSQDQLKALENQVVELANDPNITAGPTELAQGLYDIVSAGFSTSDALNILQVSSIAATAGLTDSATATNAVISVLDAYHLSADQAGHVSDVLFKTVDQGVVTFGQLANSIGTLLPTAQAAGVSLEQLGAAYVVLTRQGVNADEATTQINAVMTELLKPTDALSQALHDQGYESGYALLQSKGLGGALQVLNDIIGGNAETANKMFTNVRAVRGILGLTTNGAKDYTKALREMNKASEGVGATQRALAKQEQSNRFQLQLARKEMQVVGTVLVGMLAPGLLFVTSNLAALARGMAVFLHYLDMVLQGHSRWTKSIEDLPPGLQRAARGLALVVDALHDLFRAFQENGIQGFLDELGRIQGDRLLSGLQTLGQEAWKAFSGAIEGAASAGIDFGKILVKGALSLGGDLPSIGGDLWSWFLREIGLGPSGESVAGGNGTAGAAQVGGSGREIDFGDVVVAAGLKLEGLAADIGGDLWAFVYSQVVGGTAVSVPAGMGSRAGFQGGSVDEAQHVVPFGDIAVEAGLALEGDLKTWAGNLWGWVESQLGLGGGGGGLGAVPIGGGAVVGGHTIPLGDVAVALGNFIVQGGESLSGDVVAKVISLWNAAKTTATQLAGWGLALGGWLVTEGDSLAGAVVEKVGSWWNAAKQTATSVGGWALSAGGWLVNEGESLAGAVVEKVGSWWNTAKQTATQLAGWAVEVGQFLVQGGITLWHDIDAFVTGTLWPAVKDLPSELDQVKVEIGGWLPTVASGAQNVFDAVKTFVQDFWNGMTDKTIPLSGSVNIDTSGVGIVLDQGGNAAGPNIIPTGGGGGGGGSFAERLGQKLHQLIQAFIDVPLIIPPSDQVSMATKIQKALADAISVSVTVALDAVFIGLPVLLGKGLVVGAQLVFILFEGIVSGVVLGLYRGTQGFQRDLNSVFTDPLLGFLGGLIDPITKILDSSWQGWTQIAASALGFGKKIISTIWDNIMAGLTFSNGASAAGLFGAGSAAGPNIIPTGSNGNGGSDFVTTIFNALIQPIIDGLTSLPDKVAQALAGIPNPFGAIKDWIGNQLSSLAGGASGALGAVPLGGGAAIGSGALDFGSIITDNVVTPLLTAVQAIPGDISNQIGDTGQAILQSIADGISGQIDAGDFLNEGSSVAGQVVSAVASGFTGADFSGIGTAIWDGIKGAVTSAIPGDFIQSIVDGIIGNTPNGEYQNPPNSASGDPKPYTRPARDASNTSQTVTTTVKTIFDADTGPYAKAFTDVMTWGSIVEHSIFAATFDANDGPAAIKYTDVETWGSVWAGQSFSAIFDIDDGPAAVAYTEAFGWGETWAGQVFTASFSIDTSGLDAASAKADVVAAHIAAVMPHSPAKEGPLSKPISFQYIADDMIGVFGRMSAAADYHMGRIGGAVGRPLGGLNARVPTFASANGVAGLARGGDTYVTVKVEHAYGIDDFQNQMTKGAAKAIGEAWGENVTERHRSFGQ